MVVGGVVGLVFVVDDGFVVDVLGCVDVDVVFVVDFVVGVVDFVVEALVDADVDGFVVDVVGFLVVLGVL